MARDTDSSAPRAPRREVIIKRDCKLCKDQVKIDYKQPDLLKKFMTERGKILSRRLSGNCAKHQRQLATAIKRARTMLLVR
jgi:small subunit ribosomal protein S18